MKRFFSIAFLFIGFAAALYFLPIRQDSALYGLKSFIVRKVSSITTSSADLRVEILYKKQEMRAYEDVIAKIDAEYERMKADAPICAITGQKGTVSITKDPRPELQEKIERLRVEIAELESRI